MYLHCCLLIGTSTNVGRYKHKTYKRRTVQTSDQYKHRTSTNVRLVQTWDGHIYKEKRRTKEEKNIFEFSDYNSCKFAIFSQKKFPIFFIKNS